jgi:hypothetical protein
MPVHGRLILTMAAPIANGISLSQKPSSGGVQALLLNGSLVVNGVAILDVPRQVAITSSGNDSAITFTITGTNYLGITQSETLLGPNTGTVASALYYSTVTSITVSGNTTGNITVGTNGAATSPWFPMNYNRYPVSSQICDLSPGAVLTYTVQFTGDDLQAARNASVTAIAQNHSTLTLQTVNNTGTLISGVCGLRIITTAFTSGSVTMNIIQSSATNG